MNTMKAIRYHQFGTADVLQLESVTVPIPQKGEVIVQVLAAALNPKDILIRKGKFTKLDKTPFPKMVGFDFAGVVATANAHPTLNEGDEVFGMINGWQGRTVAEYLAVPFNELTLKPSNIDFEAASGIALAGQTALQSIRDLGHLQQGQSICINGASGGVGTLAIQIAKILGGEVTTISSKKNFELCQSLGADQCIDYQATNILHSQRRYDLFYDVFGNYKFQKIKHLLKPKGTYVTTVPNINNVLQHFASYLRTQKSRLVVVKSNTKDLNWLSQQLKAGALQPVVDTCFDIADTQQAQLRIESKRARGKVVIKVKR